MGLDSVSGMSSAGSGVSTTPSTSVDLVSAVASDGLESVLIMSARVDSCESELSLAGLVGEFTGEI